jgi:mannose-1-phosphate guanylyltransferase
VAVRHLANTWAIVLAGGDGARLRTLTKTRDGEVIPKQYCSFGRPTCLLQDALQRASSVVAAAHVCTVVAAQHRRWWSSALSQVHDTNVFVQPKNMGTGHGILLALLRLSAINPDGIVTLLPADHFFRDEGPITRTLRTAVNLAVLNPQAIYLLGSEPDRPDSELGYILPAERASRTAMNVIGFTEKPAKDYAKELVTLGALWNLFILIGKVGTLLELFEDSYSREIADMRAAIEREKTGDVRALEVHYDRIAPMDFSRDVLELQAPRLQVICVPSCGWTDLGTPQRVEATARNLSASGGIARRYPVSHSPLFFDLAAFCGASGSK